MAELRHSQLPRQGDRREQRRWRNTPLIQMDMGENEVQALAEMLVAYADTAHRNHQRERNNQQT